MKYLFAAIGLLLLPALVQAQTHPCDGTPETEYRVKRNQSVVAGWCHDSKDDEGNPITLTGFRLMVETSNGIIEALDMGLPAPLTGPNAAGWIYYESESVLFQTNASVSVVAYSADGDGLSSTPITVRVYGPARAPKGLRVIAGVI